MQLKMGLNRWYVLASLACFVLLAAQQAQHATSQDISDNNANQSDPPGLLGLLFTPIRATIDQARRFLGHRVEDAQHGLDRVRLETFKIFMRLYNKTYSAEELPRRMALFFDRRKEIAASVKAFAEGRLPFMMRENAFLDWDENELKALTGVSPPRRPSELAPEELEVIYNENEIKSNQYYDKDAPFAVRSFGAAEPSDYDDDDTANLTVRAQTIPATKDWRTSGCVSAPINQHNCGACYAVATMGVIETMHCFNHKSSPVLSVQQVVDCSTPKAGYLNYGCEGGWPTRVLKYLQDVEVASRDICYPFVRRQMTCRLRQVQAVKGCTLSASPTDTKLRYKVLNNENDILYHVANTGPVVTVIRTTKKFLYYGSGVFDDPTCSKKRDDLDHAIVIVGYGRENGQDYWLIKNSWGTEDWGEGGYAKFKRGTNACSIGHWGWVILS